MATFLFVLGTCVVATIGWFVGRSRLAAMRRAAAEREAEQAIAIEALRREAATRPAERAPAAEIRVGASGMSVDTSSASTLTAPRQHDASDVTLPVAPEQSQRMRTAADRADGAAMPSRESARRDQPASAPLDSERLRGMRPSRFARVCLAYLESTGFRVKRHDGPEKVDALLYRGASQVPMMAVRFSRAGDRQAASSEVIQFGAGASALGVQHRTFFAQNGATLNATRASVENAVTLVSADQLAAKIAAMPDDRQALIGAAAQERASA